MTGYTGSCLTPVDRRPRLQASASFIPEVGSTRLWAGDVEFRPLADIPWAKTGWSLTFNIQVLSNYTLDPRRTRLQCLRKNVFCPKKFPTCSENMSLLEWQRFIIFLLCPNVCSPYPSLPFFSRPFIFRACFRLSVPFLQLRSTLSFSYYSTSLVLN